MPLGPPTTEVRIAIASLPAPQYCSRPEGDADLRPRRRWPRTAVVSAACLLLGTSLWLVVPKSHGGPHVSAYVADVRPTHFALRPGPAARPAALQRAPHGALPSAGLFRRPDGSLDWEAMGSLSGEREMLQGFERVNQTLLRDPLLAEEHRQELQASLDRLEVLKDAMLDAARDAATASDRRIALQHQFESTLKSVLAQMQGIFDSEPALRATVVGTFLEVNDVMAEIQRTVKQLTSRDNLGENDRKSIELAATSLMQTTKDVASWATQTDVGRFCSQRLRELQPTLSMVLAESADYLGMLRNQTSSLVSQVSIGVSSGMDLVGNGIGSGWNVVQSQVAQTTTGLTEYLGSVYNSVPELGGVLAGVAEQAAGVLHATTEVFSDKSWELGLWTRKLTEDLQFTAWAYKQGSKIGAIKDPVIAEYHKAHRQAHKIWNRPAPFWARVRGVAAVFLGLMVIYFRGIVHWMSGWVFDHLRPPKALHQKRKDSAGKGHHFHLMKASASSNATIIPLRKPGGVSGAGKVNGKHKLHRKPHPTPAGSRKDSGPAIGGAQSFATVSGRLHPGSPAPETPPLWDVAAALQRLLGRASGATPEAQAADVEADPEAPTTPSPAEAFMGFVDPLDTAFHGLTLKMRTALAEHWPVLKAPAAEGSAAASPHPLESDAALAPSPSRGLEVVGATIIAPPWAHLPHLPHLPGLAQFGSAAAA